MTKILALLENMIKEGSENLSALFNPFDILFKNHNNLAFHWIKI